jgi:hypothetical protein
MTKQHENHQSLLFDLEGVTRGEETGKRHYWYYITDARNENMVIGLDMRGAPIMGEHDTRPTYGLWPHLFNTRRLAQIYRDKHIPGGNVKQWLFSYK